MWGESETFWFDNVKEVEGKIYERFCIEIRSAGHYTQLKSLPQLKTEIRRLKGVTQRWKRRWNWARKEKHQGRDRFSVSPVFALYTDRQCCEDGTEIASSRRSFLSAQGTYKCRFWLYSTCGILHFAMLESLWTKSKHSAARPKGQKQGRTSWAVVPHNQSAE